MWSAAANTEVAPPRYYRIYFLLILGLVSWCMYVSSVGGMLSGTTLREVVYRLPVCISLAVASRILLQSRGQVRVGACLLVLSNVSFLITSLWVAPETIGARPWLFTLYALWYGIDMCILGVLLPLRRVPLSVLLRTGANTVVAMSVIEVIFNILLPLWFTTWNTSFMGRMAQFRLDTSLAVAWGYLTIIRQIPAIASRPRIAMVVSLVALVAVDSIMVWASLLVPSLALRDARLNPYLPYGLWTIALCVALSDAHTSFHKWHWSGPSVVSQVETLQQSILRSTMIIIVLVILITINPSQGHNIWFVIALIGREIISRYERELFLKRQVELQSTLQEKNSEIANLHHNRMRWVDHAAHDLGHALVTQQTTVDQAVYDLEGRLSRQELDTLQTNLERGIRYQTQVLDELREVAQMEAGQSIRLHWSRVDLNKLVMRIGQQFRAQLDAQDVTFTIECPKNALIINGDERRLHRILQNLMVNALRAIRDNPHPHITIAMTSTHRAILLSVADDGHGISSTELERLRKNGYQSSTGVGLHFCAHILMQHGGSIDIVSQEGEGTIVRLKLPAGEDDV